MWRGHIAYECRVSRTLQSCMRARCTRRFPEVESLETVGPSFYTGFTMKHLTFRTKKEKSYWLRAYDALGLCFLAVSPNMRILDHIHRHGRPAKTNRDGRSPQSVHSQPTMPPSMMAAAGQSRRVGADKAKSSPASSGGATSSKKAATPASAARSTNAATMVKASRATTPEVKAAVHAGIGAIVKAAGPIASLAALTSHLGALGDDERTEAQALWEAITKEWREDDHSQAANGLAGAIASTSQLVPSASSGASTPRLREKGSSSWREAAADALEQSIKSSHVIGSCAPNPPTATAPADGPWISLDDIETQVRVAIDDESTGHLQVRISASLDGAAVAAPARGTAAPAAKDAYVSSPSVGAAMVPTLSIPERMALEDRSHAAILLQRVHRGKSCRLDVAKLRQEAASGTAASRELDPYPVAVASG